MTNIITAITFLTLATNWHPVSGTRHEVQIVTESTHLQFGTNTFLLSTRDWIGPSQLRDAPIQSNLFFVTNWAPLLEWRDRAIYTTNNAVIDCASVPFTDLFNMESNKIVMPEFPVGSYEANLAEMMARDLVRRITNTNEE